MKSFKDTAGRQWNIAVTIGAAKRIKDTLGVDLLRLDRPSEDDQLPLLTRLGVDELLLAEIICCLIGEKQFAEHEVTENDIRDSFDGSTMLAAQTAFYEELIDFFRSRGRDYLATAIEKQLATIQAAANKAEAILEKLDPETLVSVPESLTSGKTFGASPDSLASTPGH